MLLNPYLRMKKKTGKEICEGTLKFQCLRENSPSFEYVQINSKKQLFEKFLSIEKSIIEFKYLPYLHFEIHGSDDKSGLFLNSNELLEWNELYESLQSINIRCKNNLFISLATCYGAYMIRAYNNPTEPCPFYG